MQALVTSRRIGVISVVRESLEVGDVRWVAPRPRHALPRRVTVGVLLVLPGVAPGVGVAPVLLRIAGRVHEGLGLRVVEPKRRARVVELALLGVEARVLLDLPSRRDRREVHLVGPPRLQALGQQRVIGAGKLRVRGVSARAQVHAPRLEALEHEAVPKVHDLF
jgi:hypothetical protein